MNHQVMRCGLKFKIRTMRVEYTIFSTTIHLLMYFSANRPNNFTASLGSICMASLEHDSVGSAATTSVENSDDNDDDGVGLLHTKAWAELSSNRKRRHEGAPYTMVTIRLMGTRPRSYSLDAAIVMEIWRSYQYYLSVRSGDRINIIYRSG